jgi:hypothetical protein
MRRNLGLGAAALLILALGFAGAASAQVVYQMSGEWYRNSGPLIDIPANGGQTVCTGGAPNGCVFGLKPINGGVPGFSKIAVAPGGSFTVPPLVFGQRLGKQVAAVPFVPTVVQLSSQFYISGPPTLATTGMPPTPVPAQMMNNAWMMDPGQTARLAKTFAWCPVVGGPNCTNSKAGPYTGMVSYTNPNPNAFGGTMALLLHNTAVVSIVAGTAPTGGGGTTSLLGHNLVGGGPPNPQPGGRGYATFDTVMLAPGPIHLGFGTNPPCTNVLPALPVGCGQVTWSGPVIGSIPPDTNLNWGFPFTTGTVTVMNVQTNNGQPGTSTLTAMGTDSRTALGAGKITLVAGYHTHRVNANTDFAGMDVVIMTFKPILPSMSHPGLVAAAVLMLLAVGYAYRRRL